MLRAFSFTRSHQLCAWQAGSTSIVEGEKEAWWLDDRTKRLIEQTMRLNGTLTFTVRPGTPLRLTREQVRAPDRLG